MKIAAVPQVRDDGLGKSCAHLRVERFKRKDLAPFREGNRLPPCQFPLAAFCCYGRGWLTVGPMIVGLT